MPRNRTFPLLLLIDSDPEALAATEAALGPGHRIEKRHGAREGLASFGEIHPAAVICARTLPDGDGLGLLADMVAASPRTPVIMVLTAQTASDAVPAFRLGAWDVAVKGDRYGEELRVAVERCLARVVPERCRETTLVLRVQELEHRLDEAEEQRRALESVVEKSPAVTFLWENEPSLPVLFVSANVGRLGFNVADFGPGGSVFADCIPQADLERFLLAVERAGQGGEEIVRHELSGNDSLLRTVETRLWALRDARGRALRIQGVVMDLSGQTRAEDELRRSEALFQSLFEHCPVSLWVEDYSRAKAFCDELARNGVTDFQAHFASHPDALRQCARLVNVVDVNEEALSVLGASSRTQLLGSLSSLFGEENYPSFAERMAALASGATRFEGRGLHRLLDGRTATTQVQVSVPQGYEESLERVIVAVLDISTQADVERGAAQQADFLAQILDAIPDPVFVKERDHRVLLANEAFAALVHSPAARLVGRQCDDMVSPEDATLIHATDEQVFQTRQTVVQHLSYASSGSETRQLSIKKSAAELPQTGELVLVGVINDLTDVRSMERDLTEARDRAEAGSRAKSEFLANMSHELRTPLNAIIGMSELALETQLTKEQREFLSTIRDSGRMLLHVLNEILDLSKIEARRIDLEARDFSPASVVRGVLAAFAAEAGAKGLELLTEIDEDVPEVVRGDRVRLRQIITNLVGNAVKFTEQGAVTVRLARGTPNPKDGDVVLHFEIRDTGIGIAGDKLDAIFESFTQADGAITRRYGGTGLGLTISRRLARLMGGDIDVESMPGKGSIFRFTVRMEPGEALLADGQQQLGDPTELGTLNVLVAEDNPVNQRMIQAWLKRQGHSSMLADNGARAMELLALYCFDIVFLDVQMPVMDGLETVRAIRSAAPQQINPAIPVIAMSAHAMKGDRERFLAAGMDDYVSKPVDFERLQGAMARVMRNHLRCTARLPETQDDDGRAAGYEIMTSPLFARDEALARLGGDESFLAELIVVFLDDMPGKLDAACTAVSTGTARDVREAAHSIKGAAAAVGAEAVGALARRMENESATADRAELAELCVLLREAFAKVSPVLR